MTDNNIHIWWGGQCTGFVGINELTEDAIHVFPNPAKDRIKIQLGNNEDASLIVTDLSGKDVMTKTLSNGGEIVNVSSLTSGIYIYHLTSSRKAIIGKFAVNE